MQKLISNVQLSILLPHSLIPHPPTLHSPPFTHHPSSTSPHPPTLHSPPLLHLSSPTHICSSKQDGFCPIVYCVWTQHIQVWPLPPSQDALISHTHTHHTSHRCGSGLQGLKDQGYTNSVVCRLIQNYEDIFEVCGPQSHLSCTQCPFLSRISHTHPVLPPLLAPE